MKQLERHQQVNSHEFGPTQLPTWIPCNGFLPMVRNNVLEEYSPLVEICFKIWGLGMSQIELVTCINCVQYYYEQ